MMLVNIHKLILVALLALGLNPTQAQTQVWALQQCIDTAQVQNKNLQINRNYQALSEQKYREAKANLLPRITANADYKYFTNLPYQLLPLAAFNPEAPTGEFREAQFGVPHNINANLQLAIPLYNPQIYGAIESTQIAKELSELQLQKSEEQVYFEIANFYYNAQILQHQLTFLDSNLTNSNRLLGNIQLLQEHLLATGNDVDKIKLQTTQLKTQRETTRSKSQQILNSLKFMMGLSMEYDLEIDRNIIYTDQFSTSVSKTLDLKIVETQHRLLEVEQNTLSKSRFLPTVNLFATYGTTGFGYDKQPNSFLNFYPIGFAGIQLSYSLFNGTVTKRKINQKKIELENNALQHSLVSDQTSMQLENASLQKNVAKSTVETSTAQIQLAQSVYKQTLLQQKQGIANLTDVLLADNALREAQQGYLNAVVDYLKADLELKKLRNQLRTKN
ncbi:TolC family protein [Rhodonellum sp.]|uniref:TolC family protein n=1 Tax=Rhodonellum sp. TaxID=2231180 RepID=UPI00271B21AA|nr:TolC family protein [Rhodonellum sp.]MDO9552783.1 TolC family protein [Rhodonellum sp.]